MFKNKFTKNKIALVVAVLCILIAAFIWGGENKIHQPDVIDEAAFLETQMVGEKDATPDKESFQEPESESKIVESAPDAETRGGNIPPKPIIKPAKEELYCTLSISCATVLDNMESLTKGKEEIIPEKGVVLSPIRTIFYEGESVFNVLSREIKKNSIHMEFVKTPAYNAVYIEGINNLYEFDCGELSGWMYKVNGEFPGYSSSRYLLNDGDIIEWVYSCDWGRDVGAPKGVRQE